MQSSNKFFGVVLLLLAVLLFGFLEMTAKFATGLMPPVQVAWARFTVHALVMLVVFTPLMGASLFKTNVLKLQGIRALFMATTTLCQFVGLSHLQMAEVTTINFLAPFIVSLMAIPLLGERPGIHRWTAIIAGFIGVLVIIRPGIGTPHWAYFVILCGAVTMAFYILGTRMVADRDNPLVSLFYSSLLGALCLSLGLPFFWETPGSWIAWGCLLTVGFFGATGHYLLIIALKHVEGSLAAPYLYTQILWSVVFGYLAFGDFPDQYTWIGAGIVVSSGLYLAWREALRARRTEKGDLSKDLATKD